MRALKKEGYIYTSFKYGEYAGYREERYYTDFTENSFAAFINEEIPVGINERNRKNSGKRWYLPCYMQEVSLEMEDIRFLEDCMELVHPLLMPFQHGLR